MKLLNLTQLKTITDEYKSQGKRIVWTNGCFDLLHPGHIYSLNEAKKKGDILIVGLDSDSSIKTLKGPTRPLIPEQQRISSLEALESVNHIILFNFGEAKQIINHIRPHVYAKSGNYMLETINQSERKIVESYHGEIHLIPGLPGFSTTEIIKRIKTNKIPMDSSLFDRTKINFKPLNERVSKSGLEIMVNPDETPDSPSQYPEMIKHIATEIKKSKANNKPIIMAFGAHLIKNGLSPILIRMMEEGYLTHIATNGASTIHDWELAYQGRTEEDVRTYSKEGQFGLWEETGKYLNLAIIAGAANGRGYGESIAEMIHKDKIDIPEKLLEPTIETLKSRNILPGSTLQVNHPYKNSSFQEAVFRNSNVTYTVHPHICHDIIGNHPLSDGASIGIAASSIDYRKYLHSVSKLEGGVYLSIGSAVMSPQIFEKALSASRNEAKQRGKEIKDFMIIVNDINEGGDIDWNSSEEPSKDNPAYYLRFCKSFRRAGAREMQYIQEDNKTFLTNLYHELKSNN
ncbi:hypothetical protein CMI38_01985 [Candidatus Pacearchaeota archaeon]|jgi:rfaE bifunctional protein nucleotidyltransferase chain/domain|nr:hypothetical protein [Candidatus Pacearchaeota archaeon]|tara:strand:- start:2068 stop:3612 length:1545 start_codon:yes stop_codon:yes gene_type:complete